MTGPLPHQTHARPFSGPERSERGRMHALAMTGAQTAAFERKATPCR
jgi:hypothetical protein